MTSAAGGQRGAAQGQRRTSGPGKGAGRAGWPGPRCTEDGWDGSGRAWGLFASGSGASARLTPHTTTGRRAGRAKRGALAHGGSFVARGRGTSLWSRIRVFFHVLDVVACRLCGALVEWARGRSAGLVAELVWCASRGATALRKAPGTVQA